MTRIISPEAIARRAYWINEIQKISGVFVDDSTRVEKELGDEIEKSGVTSVIDHLRLCGDIPESYHHDSSEEKLYSKYTDAVLCEAFKAIGIKSIVIKERADVADVEGFAKNFSFVADAKSFRLSRTAKNQKDFKVQAMDRWKHGKTHAMVVCPIYQIPVKSSQIYEQASARNVCIFTYSHLSVLVYYSIVEGQSAAEELLHSIFQTIPKLNPSKDAASYWQAVNGVMLGHSKIMDALWKDEKVAAIESIAAAKSIALAFLASEREKIMRMTHAEALKELVRVHKIESRIKAINALTDNGIMAIR